MAKVPYSKLNLVKNDEVKTFNWGDQVIEVKQYLPIKEKIQLIQDVVNETLEGVKEYYDPLKAEILLLISLVDYYTNINFTDKQRSDKYKLYDALLSSTFFNSVSSNIPTSELDFIYNFTNTIIDIIFKYNNSAMGIIDNLSKDYSQLNLDIDSFRDRISDPESLNFLKEVMSKMV